MELLYFINGILFVGIIAGVVMFFQMKKSNGNLITATQTQTNLSSIANSEMENELKDLKVLILDIQSNMEKDQYENLGNINKKLEILDSIVGKMGAEVSFMQKSSDKNFSNAFSEIQQLKQNLKSLSQDYINI